MICVSGIPGSGKSTLADAIAAALGRKVVRFDDHEVLTRQPPDAVSAWLDAGAPLSADLAPGLIDAIDRAGPGAVLDHPFGRAWPGLADRIETAFWIECPYDIALARKIGALAAAGHGDPGFADWLRDWTRAYADFTRRSYGLLVERTRPTADWSIDGTRPRGEGVSRALSVPSLANLG